MPNIGAVLREEITRLARKESRSQVDPTRKAALQHRRDIAALKRQVAVLQRQLALVSRKLLSGPAALPAAKDSAKRLRFVAKGLRAHRERLGLSQANLAKLLGVSAQSVYNWENEVSRPRAEQVARIAAMRGLGKREVAARLRRTPGANN
jgi:DNA-binding XRE family transcriptional regulator